MFGIIDNRPKENAISKFAKANNLSLMTDGKYRLNSGCFEAAYQESCRIERAYITEMKRPNALVEFEIVNSSFGMNNIIFNFN